MTELYWTGQDNVEVFYDSERNIEYWPSKRPRDVSEEAVEYYLSFDGWSRNPPADDDEDEDEQTAFDPSAFIDASWQSVTAAIRDGEVDEHLDAIEAVETDRDPAPRQSVLDALGERRDELGE